MRDLALSPRRPLLCFDLDGTLWDCAGLSTEAWTLSLAGLEEEGLLAPSLGAILSRSELRRRLSSSFGLTATEFEARIVPELAPPLRSEAGRRAYAAELDLIPQGYGETYPGLKDCLRAASELADLAIVSNCQALYIEAFLERFGLASLFVDFESSGRSGRDKIENLRSVLARQGRDVGAMVGDSQGDLQAARANGLPFIHASYGFGQLGPGEADFTISNLDDLPSLLEELWRSR